MALPIQSSILFLFMCMSFSTHAQSFWKKWGQPTNSLASHSSLLFLPEQQSVLVGTYNLGIYKSKEDATDWEHLLFLSKDEPVYCFTRTSEGTILAGGAGVIYRSESNGDKWESYPAPLQNVQEIVDDGLGNLYMHSYGTQGIFKSRDDGHSWQPYNTGISGKEVDGLATDGKGNVFSLVYEGEDIGTGGLYYLDQSKDTWSKKAIHVVVDGVSYPLKVAAISSMAISSHGELLLSFDGIVTNFAIFGVFRNTVNGAIQEDEWSLEIDNEAMNRPFSQVLDELFITRNHHFFGSRMSSSSPGIYSKLQYMPDWNFSVEGIEPIAQVKGIFCELEDGSVVLTNSFTNQLYITHETIPGKKVQQISFELQDKMKLYQEVSLMASVNSGRPVKFKSLNENIASVQGNVLRAQGLSRVAIKAFADGDEEFYYSEESLVIEIEKAENLIQIEGVQDVIEGDTLVLNTSAYSGLPVHLEVTAGTATFKSDTLVYNGPGRVEFVATEPGNETYAPADTLSFSICIFPKKPGFTIIEDSLTGLLTLKSTVEKGNIWYLDGIPLSKTGQEVQATKAGNYQLQVIKDDCASELSEPFLVTGLPKEGLNQEIKLYPMPFRNELFIYRSGKALEEVQFMTLYDLRGTKVLNLALPQNQVFRIDTTTLNAGMYYVTIQSAGKVSYFTIFKI